MAVCDHILTGDEVTPNMKVPVSRKLTASPQSMRDALSQLVVLWHSIGVAIDHLPDPERMKIAKPMHRIVEFLALDAGIELRDIGGRDYLIGSCLSDSALEALWKPMRRAGSIRRSSVGQTVPENTTVTRFATARSRRN